MKGAMRARATRTPHAVPQAVAARTPARHDASGPCPARRRLATTTVVKATEDPTERSMPPLTMTKVMPMDPSATTAV